jgi:hypothetical protein
MANWEKKSAYLLREIVKFKTYVDSLKAAQEQKEVIDKERETRAPEKAALSADATQDASTPIPAVEPVTHTLEAAVMPPQTAQSV